MYWVEIFSLTSITDGLMQSLWPVLSFLCFLYILLLGKLTNTRLINGAKWYVGANFSYMIDQRMRNPNGLHPTTVGCHVDGGDGFKQTGPKGCLVLYAENGKGKGKDEGGAVESGNHKSCSSILISLFVVCFLP